MVRFQTIPLPYKDILIVSFKTEDGYNTALGELIPFADTHGCYVQREEHTRVKNTFLIQPDASLKHQSFHPWIFSGFGKINRRMVLGETDFLEAIIHTDQSDLDNCVGQFTAFQFQNDHIAAHTDLFGYGHLFVSEQPDFCILSNRLHLHNLFFKHLTGRARLHIPATLALLFSHNIFFSQQNMSQDMLLQGVRQLPVDRRVKIVNGSLIIEEKPGFTQLLQSSPEHYDVLLEQGVQDIVENSAIALRRDKFKNIIVDLSGGKDSRMVFGSVLNVPQWQESARFFTRDVANSDDLNISCGIMHMFGGQYNRQAPAHQESLTLDQNIHLWRSYFQGLYHRMGATAWTSAGKNLDALSLSGGNGEILRTFWGPNLQRYSPDDQDIEAFCRRMVADSTLTAPISPEQADTIAQYVHGVLHDLPGENLQQKLEAHYLYFRNRAHFGLRGFSFYHEQLTWFPLMSGNLLKAAHSLSFEQRAQGKLVYDITKKLNPVLPHLPYDGGDAFEGLELPTTETVFESSWNTDRTQWQDAKTAWESDLNAKRANKPLQMLWSKWPGAVDMAAMQAFENSSKTVQSLIGETFVNRMRDELTIASKRGFDMASRLFAVCDAADI